MREQGLRFQTKPRVDWFAILIELGRKGMTTASVGEQIDVPKGTILGWKQGAEPKHGDGERLIELWLRMTGHERAQVPLTCAPRWLDR